MGSFDAEGEGVLEEPTVRATGFPCAADFGFAFVGRGDPERMSATDSPEAVRSRNAFRQCSLQNQYVAPSCTAVNGERSSTCMWQMGSMATLLPRSRIILSVNQQGLAVEIERTTGRLTPAARLMSLQLI
jgi:hypothetical protein